MTNTNEPTDDTDPLDDEPAPALQLLRPEEATMAALNRSEIEVQMDAAHRYPRVLSTFRKEATTIATATQEIAKTCMYSLERWDSKERKKKYIIGPSIRLAEIVAATYGNLHSGSRVVDVGETTVTCQGVAWDVQRNVRQVAEVTRRITTTNGNRFSEDMIIVTQNAASAIALRNAIFRVVPRALIERIFTEVREMAAGGKKPIAEKQKDIIAALGRLGVSPERALDAVDRKTPEDLTLEDIEALIGLGSRVKEKEESIDEVFPPRAAAAEVKTEGKREPMRAKETPAAAAAKPVDKPAAKSSAGDDDEVPEWARRSGT
jgi:hypothetical protein